MNFASKPTALRSITQPLCWLALALVVLGLSDLPLPRGEGWGEGEHYHRVSQFTRSIKQRQPTAIGTVSRNAVPLTLPSPQGEGSDANLVESHSAFCILHSAILNSNRTPLLPTDTVGLCNRNPFITLCQALGPAAPCNIPAVDCSVDGPCGCNCSNRRWRALGPVNWQAYAQGEYVGHWRDSHVPVYRLRVDDLLECVYRITRNVQPDPYRLNPGDIVQVESFTDDKLNRELVIQPDGTITLRLLGEMRAAGLTAQELRKNLDEAYSKFYKLPSITVTPLKVNTQLDDLRATVDNRAGQGGQGRPAKITPQGTIDLPGLNNIPAQGLTLDELKEEIDLRYKEQLGIQGIEVTPILTQRAARYVFVFGEVKNPGRFTLEGPTTLMQAISLAGSWNNGANLRQIAIFRRGDDWRLMATLVNMQGTMLFNKQPCPKGEIWIDDSDIVMVAKSPILIADDLINLYFTKGLYSVLPFSTFYSFNAAATVVN
ncbi:MAG TPA: polysaccharide biosynthesis/export family protein [Pirellulales bacterium]